ncbi:MAG: efflux RND transporter permease subunit [Phycisphaerales bacterium]|nr:MAG: efflux RND transporter permease subunit [Phycisphaerales bacterium]
MSLSSFGVHRPVVANLVMLVIIGAGIIFGLNLRREFFPETRPNEVIITAPYPGAAPDEIESSLAIKIEDRIADLRGVKEINTTVSEGVASIRVEFVSGTDINIAVARVKREIDALQDLPERAERITVAEFEPNIPVVMLTLVGESDEAVMKRIIRQMREDLRVLPGMGDVFVSGVRTDEISVEVRESAMLEHAVSLPHIAQRIREGMAELPGGAVRAPGGNVAVRTVGAQERADEVRSIVVRSDEGGRPLLVGEIAEVTEGFVDADIFTRLNNRPAVSLTAYAVGDQDVVEMAEMVKAYAAGRMRQSIEPTLRERIALLTGAAERGEPPPRIAAYELGLSREAIAEGDLVTHSDIARFVSQRLELLSRNALWGGMLVFIVLLLLLAPMVAIWVTVGLVISILGTLAVMHFAGITLNLLTMFGLIVVLGLLVDDAIVVAENIAARHEAGDPPIKAAIAGATQVEWPVIATVLTTICAFLPLRLIDGRIGDLMGSLPLVVVCALSVSLVECLLILPSHMGHSLQVADRRRATGGRLRRTLRRIDRAREGVFQNVLVPFYTRLLHLCLRHRYLSLCVAVATLIVSVGMVTGGRAPFVFLVSADSETVIAELRMPIGTPIGETDKVIRRLEAATLALDEVDTVFTLVGAVSDIEGAGAVSQSHLAQLFIELKPVEQRDRRSDEVIVAIQQSVGDLPGVRSLRFSELQGGPGGTDVTLTVVSDRPALIAPVVRTVKEELSEFDGVFGVADDADSGQRELRITLRDGAAELGFTTESLAMQVRAAVFGLEAYTFAGDREDVDVRVMRGRDARRSLNAIETMWVFTPDARPVPLGEIARIEEAESYATIRRLDRVRAVTVNADVDDARANTETVMRELAPTLRDIERANPGVRILQRGRQQDMADSFRTLPLGMLAAVGMIYVILAWLFSSFLQPLIVLCAVPFAVIGAVWGHLLLGFEITILSLIGFVALTGIVVNDSLVLMKFYNDQRAKGVPIYDALINSGRARLRAIILTTMTTVFGLSPLMMEQSFQARFLIPMAITISFGLLGATVLILLVLPCMLLIVDDIRRFFRAAWDAGRTTPPEPAPQPQPAIADEALPR